MEVDETNTAICAIKLSDIRISGISDEARTAIEAAIRSTFIQAADAPVTEPAAEQTSTESAIPAAEVLLSLIKKTRKKIPVVAAEIQEVVVTEPEKSKMLSKCGFFNGATHMISKYFRPEYFSTAKASYECLLNKELAPICQRTHNTGIQMVVLIVGCGGTGARLLNLMAQFAAFTPTHSVQIILVDDDTVETKNLSRQLFYEFEVGRNKAEVLADRYNMLYGLNITYSESKVGPTTATLVPSGRNVYIFDCTDNLEARESIHDFKHQLTMADDCCKILISCGNQKDFGQVVFGGDFTALENMKDTREFQLGSGEKSINHTFDNINKCISSLYHFRQYGDRISYLPTMLNYYPDLKDTESESCADMEIVEEQSIAINSTVAQTAFNMFFAFINRSARVKSAITWVNLDNDYSSNKLSTYDDLLSYYARTIYGRNLYGKNLEKAKIFLDNMTDLYQHGKANAVSGDKPTMKIISDTCHDAGYASDFKASFPNKLNCSNDWFLSIEDYTDELFALEDSWLYLPMFAYINHHLLNLIFRNYFERFLATKKMTHHFLQRVLTHYGNIEKTTNFKFFRG